MPHWLSPVKYDLASLEVAFALSSNRSVLAVRDQVTAARYGVDSAAFPNPELEYLGGTTRSCGPAGNPGDARSAILTQPLDLPWRRAARIGAAEAGLKAAGAGARAFEADVLAHLRERYFEYFAFVFIGYAYFYCVKFFKTVKFCKYQMVYSAYSDAVSGEAPRQTRPHLRGLPVVAPHSCPFSLKFSRFIKKSVGKGPSPYS